MYAEVMSDEANRVSRDTCPHRCGARRCMGRAVLPVLLARKARCALTHRAIKERSRLMATFNPQMRTTPTPGNLRRIVTLSVAFVVALAALSFVFAT